VIVDDEGTDVADLGGYTREELAQLTGQSGEAAATIGIPRLFINIDSEIRENDADVEVPIKTLGVRHPELGLVFLKEPTVRMVLNQYMYRRWDNDAGKWGQISTIIPDYRRGAEAPDTLGNVNCGKTVGYVSKEDWEALPKDVQDHQKAAKLTRVLYALVSGDGVTLDGKAVTIEPMLTVWFIGMANFKVVGAVIAAIEKRKGLMFHYNQTWKFIIDKDGPRPLGVANITVDYSNTLSTDKAFLQALPVALDDVKAHNKYVMEQHNKVLRSGNADVTKDTDDVSDFIDVTNGSNSDLDDEIPF
jgi:hypothetical protein